MRSYEDYLNEIRGWSETKLQHEIDQAAAQMQDPKVTEEERSCAFAACVVFADEVKRRKG